MHGPLFGDGPAPGSIFIGCLNSVGAFASILLLQGSLVSPPTHSSTDRAGSSERQSGNSSSLNPIY